MLGKAKGQILRIAACFQMFFGDTTQGDDDHVRIIPATTLSTTIMEDSLKAAINFVEASMLSTHCIYNRKADNRK